MIGLTFLYTLAAAPLLSLAAPTDANIALARKYAPQFRFEKGEKFFGSSIEYFLSGPITPKDGNGNTVGGGISLNAANLNTLPNSGDGVFLDTPTDSGALNGFLVGQNPANNNGARVYTFVAPKANNVVDLFYWLFTPYNLAKTVPVLGQVGNHVGDWERLKVRTVNGTATQVEYHAHGDTGSGTIPWDQVAKFDNNQRPVGYVASGSHGFWATPGTFTYVNAVIFQLQDVTSDGGVYWDTKDSLSIINYPDTYTGDLGWLTYRGRWGSKGTTDCWWHFIYSECERVDAPTGPLRDDVLGVASLTGSPMPAANGDMDIPMMHTLATVSRSPNSRYTVYSKTVATQFVGIQQTCTAGSDGNAGHPTQNIDFPTNGTVVKRAEPEPESQYTFASVAAPKKAGRIDLTVAGCPEGFAITGYSFGPCSGKTADTCNFLPTRAIRAYAPGAQGVQAARAVEVEDLDFW